MLDLKKVSHASIFLLLFSVFKSILSLILKSSIAKFFGAGELSDAYFAAFTIPQELGDFFIGGILFMIIIPVFQKRKTEAGEDAAAKDISGMLNIAALSLIFLTALYILMIPWIIPALFSGFTGKKLELTVRLSYFFSPAMPLMGLSLIYISFYHAYRDFLSPSIAVLLFPLCSLASLWLLPNSWGIQRLIWGNLTGTILGLVLLIVLMHKRIPWRPGNWNVWNPVTQKTILLSIPVVVSFVISRIIPFLQKSLASQVPMEGTVTLIEYSSFLANTAFFFVLTPISTAIYPLLAKQCSEEKKELSVNTFSLSLKTVIFLSMPFLLFFTFESYDIIACIFNYGSFAVSDIPVCANLLAIFSIMIIPFCITKLINQIFLIKHSTKGISIISIIGTILSIPCYFLFSKLWGVYGLAAAYSLMCVIISSGNIILLKKYGGGFKLSLIFKGLTMIILVSAISGAVFLSAGKFLPVQNCYLRLFFISSAGFAAYFLAAFMLRLEEFNFIVRKLPFASILITEKQINE